MTSICSLQTSSECGSSSLPLTSQTTTHTASTDTEYTAANKGAALRTTMSLLATSLICMFCVLSFSFNDAKAAPRCPIACRCTPDKGIATLLDVSCRQKQSWTRIPTLPMNTTSFEIRESNLKIIFADSFSKTSGKYFKRLKLDYNGIEQIEIGAFKSLNQLSSLSMNHNKLDTLAKNTFSKIPNLRDLYLQGNLLDSIPEANLCLLPQLGRLILSVNQIHNISFGECFLHLPKLYRIDLSSNPIGEIHSEDFFGLRNSTVAELYLTNLNLLKLNRHIFKFIPNIKYLSLKRNKFVSIDSNFLSTRLTSLILKDNRLKEIPHEAIRNLSRLESLNMERNKITNSTFGSDFQNLRRLVLIDLSKNPLKVLRNVSFANLRGCSKLNELILSQCGIREIEADAFRPLKSLESLKLDSNVLNITKIEKAFHGLRFAYNLTKLNLKGLNLEGLKTTTFQSLENTSVSYLQATATKLYKIRSNTFRHLPNLKYLSLSSCLISSLEPDAFQNLNKLERLDLTGNRLFESLDARKLHLMSVRTLLLGHNLFANRLHVDNFRHFRQVEEFQLNGNLIQRINENSFAHMPNLHRLNLRSNKISFLESNAFAGLDKLEHLDLQENLIQGVSESTFTGIPSLKTLDLQRNHYLASGESSDLAHAFRPLTNLTSLYLISTGLKELPETTLHNLTQLRVLKLSNNQLTFFPAGLFEHQQRLIELAFTLNRITEIQEASMKPLKSLREVYPAMNTFSCNCDLLWFIGWMRSGSVYFDNVNKITCRTPSVLDGTRLVDLDIWHECLATFYYIYWGFFFSYLVLITVMTVSYRLRWYIRFVLLFSLLTPAISFLIRFISCGFVLHSAPFVWTQVEECSVPVNHSLMQLRACFFSLAPSSFLLRTTNPWRYALGKQQASWMVFVTQLLECRSCSNSWFVNFSLLT